MCPLLVTCQVTPGHFTGRVSPLTDEATEADVPAPPSAPWHGSTFGLAWGPVSSAPDNR